MEERFLKFVEKTDTCWLWTGSSRRGYGQFSIDNHPHKSHRVSYKMYNGDIPEGHDIRHTCDVRLCVNPAHLLTGTRKENVADMDARGRRNNANHLKGEKHPRAKLTQDEVNAIRILKGFGFLNRELGDMYGVSKDIVARIIRYQNWK
jgi:predicted DNA-binding protein (UPF0251 family)